MKSIIDDKSKVCFICGKYGYLEEHHIFGGANRKHSEKYGLKVKLCTEDHRQKNGVHSNAEKSNRLKRIGQRVFEKEYGHEKYMKIFGKNYL